MGHITRVNMHEAKTHLSRLIDAVERGETVIICRAGKPVASLGPADKEPKKPLTWIGLFKGQINVAPDAFDPDPEMERLFTEGDPPPPPLPGGG